MMTHAVLVDDATNEVIQVNRGEFFGSQTDVAGKTWIEVTGDAPIAGQIMQAGGVFISPTPPPAPPITQIHIAWFKAALARIGKLDAVNAAVGSLSQEMQQLWDYATTIKITDPQVIQIAAALSVDLPALFATAEEIRVEREG